MEVLTEPEDIRLNRSSTKVEFNSSFEKTTGKDSEDDSKSNTLKDRNPCLEVLTEPDDVKKNRESTQVEFNEVYGDDIQEESSDKESFEEELIESGGKPDTFTDDSLYEDDFNTSSSTSEDTRSSDECDNERCQTIEENLGNGIIVKYPEEYRFKSSYVSRPLEVYLRNTLLSTLNEELADSTFATDIYGIYHKTEEAAELAMLPIADSWRGEVQFVVSVQTKCSSHFRYFAHLRREGRWNKIPVQMQDNVAEFKGEAFDVLFLTSMPNIEIINLDPQGKEFISKYDNKIKMIFPPECVKTEEVLKVQIFPQRNRGPVCIDDQPCIIGASKSVLVKHRKGIFKKPIEMNLELRLFDNAPTPDLAIFSFVDVHAINKKKKEINMYQLAPGNYKQNDRGFSVRMTVDDFTSHSVQLGNHRKMITETEKLLVRMAHDEIFHCRILIFVSKKNANNYQGDSIRVDCVENKQVQDTIAEVHGRNNGFIELERCRSHAIFIEDGERIRIGLRQGMRLPLGFRKDQMVITFLREGLHKHIVFPVETKFGNRPTNLGYLDFDRVDSHGGSLHTAFFDVDFPFKSLNHAEGAASRMSLDPGVHLMNPLQEASSLVSIPTSNESRSNSANPAGEDQGNISERIILSLTKELPPREWKFIFRDICGESRIKSESIISEAEINNNQSVKEVMYQSLRKWAAMANFRHPQQMFDAIIQGLRNGTNPNIADILEKTFLHEFK